MFVLTSNSNNCVLHHNVLILKLEQNKKEINILTICLKTLIVY